MRAWLLLAAQNEGVKLSDEVTKALIAATVGFAFALLLERLKRRREPLRRLSWESKSVSRIPTRTNEDRAGLTVLYRGHKVEGLWEVTCRVANTGNVVVKGEFIRFVFPQGCEVLEGYTDPPPPPEYGVTERRRPGSPENDPQFFIAHLERGQDVTFRFVVSGLDIAQWQPVPFNENGDVLFDERSATRDREDAEHLAPFVVVATLLLFLPSAFDFFEGATPLASVVRLILVGLLAPHLGAVSRIASRVVQNLAAPTTPSTHLAVSGDIHAHNLVVGSTVGSTGDDEHNAATRQERPT